MAQSITDIEERLLRSVQSEASFPGVALASFTKDGTSHSFAAGPKDSIAGTEVDLDTGFWVFSVTKLFTAISTLQCIEKGLVGLDDPVGQILPELAKPQIISPSPESDPPFKLVPATQSITVRQLLTHTSGLSYDAMNPNLLAWRKSRGETPLTMTGSLIDAYSLPLLFEPGSGWSYGCSLDWAGVLVERLNGGIKLGEYFKKHILDPLGLKHTTFHPLDRPDGGAYLAKMHTRNAEGRLIQIDSPYPTRPHSEKGGMGLVTTSNDLVEVLRDILKDKPLLLKEESISLLFTPQVASGDSRFADLVKQNALHSQLTGDGTETPNVAFGLAAMIVGDGGVPVLPAKSLTWNGMPNIGWFINREEDVGAIYLTQMLPPGETQSVSLLQAYWKSVVAARRRD
ncbi:hypothetical protein N0V84_010515 [Fusarium piperis]|uniref:Beta-lactamase-related domain-containing protein n=1 Tax=Fusarium piperis TaxID=1435070 RepID=A0A9W8W4M5_9HYPO|nr:hypothetical protein N0V84_010515 [Fusarium piperis]